MELAADLGVNHDTNFNHIGGESRTGFEGRLKIVVEPGWSVNF